MTTKLNHGESRFGKQRRPDSKYFAHFQNLLGKAAAEANYEPFTYHFEGYDLRIGKEMVNALKAIYVNQLTICNDLMEQIAELIIETNGDHAEFLSTPIEDMGFSTRTFHGLYAKCKTMLDVAKLGSYRVSQIRRIGPKSVVEIRDSFIKAGCVELFDTEEDS